MVFRVDFRGITGLCLGIINALWLEHTEMMDKDSEWTENLDRLHKPFDIAFFRTLSLLLGLYHVGLLMWDPIQYADSIGGFNVMIAPLFIWAVCASAVFSIGFKTQATIL